MDLGKTLKVQGYSRTLTLDKNLGDKGWNCDKIPGVNYCLSGLTGFH